MERCESFCWSNYFIEWFNVFLYWLLILVIMGLVNCLLKLSCNFLIFWFRICWDEVSFNCWFVWDDWVLLMIFCILICLNLNFLVLFGLMFGGIFILMKRGRCFFFEIWYNFVCFRIGFGIEIVDIIVLRWFGFCWKFVSGFYFVLVFLIRVSVVLRVWFVIIRFRGWLCNLLK